jgi:hypothetical protein
LSCAGIAGYVEDAVFQAWRQMYVEEEEHGGRSRRGQPFVLLVEFLDIVNREL